MFKNKYILTIATVLFSLWLSSSQVIAQDNRIDQAKIEALAKELGMSSERLSRELNSILKFAPNGDLTGATMEFNGFTVDLGTLTILNRIEDNGEDVCSKIVDNSFRSFCLNSFDKNKDGRVSLIEASEVKTIKVPGKGIHSLAGIENFENLTSLDCNDNQLTQLDVSKNTKLKMLSCNDNQLTQLDVSKNTSLEDFGCSYNQLSFLDVSKNAALQQLFCEHNKLSKLNVSGCSALKKLSCENNQLTSLVINGATALEELVCNDNQLTSLDISRNTALWSLICHNNRIANLDTSRNPRLSYIVLEKNSNQRESTKVQAGTTKQLAQNIAPNARVHNGKETAEVWATPAGSEVFKLFPDGTADVKMDVSYRTKWEQDDDEFIFIGGTGTVKQWMLDSSTGSVFAVYASSVTQRPVAKLVRK